MNESTPVPLLGSSAVFALVSQIPIGNGVETTTGVPTRTCAWNSVAPDAPFLRITRPAVVTAVMTSDRQPAREDQWLQPRFTVRREDDDNVLQTVLNGRVARPQWMYRLRCAAKQWRAWNS